ncbi:MAG TPA: hypothetical protein VNY05_10245 [Candidatus Acidoferrales bacterium]|nr:hypothetical protein [Candidatus Acidoferrales bacterium]
MKRKILTVVMAATVAFSLVSLTAQEKKMDAKKAVKGGILHPEMAVEHGTYDAPMASIGTKPDQPWSTTSVAAGVDSKPQPGHAVTVVGEIVDFSCYLQLGKHGEKHRACGQKCINNGQAIGLLSKDGTLYMLMPEEHDPRRDGGVDAKASAADHMGHIVSVSGTEAAVNGYRGIFVLGLTK